MRVLRTKARIQSFVNKEYIEISKEFWTSAGKERTFMKPIGRQLSGCTPKLAADCSTPERLSKLGEVSVAPAPAAETQSAAGAETDLRAWSSFWRALALGWA